MRPLPREPCHGFAIPDETNQAEILFPNLGVIIQTSPGIFEHQPSRADQVRGQIQAGVHGDISKRSYADILYCSDTQCTD
ncbi:hypothetical protein NHQ30_008177 [Ciborinia camelliae]|nr:hypothetical protein NHQ30_008177 [Ciborinia camelliae]